MPIEMELWGVCKQCEKSFVRPRMSLDNLGVDIKYFYCKDCKTPKDKAVSTSKSKKKNALPVSSKKNGKV